MLERSDLERMARAARKHGAAKLGPSVGVVARDCPCVACRYNLKGVKFDGVCPECGAPVSRSIDPSDPDAEPWVDAGAWRPGWWINLFGPPKPAEKQRPVPESAKPKATAAPLTCGACGYDCKGLPPGRPCPECGTPRLASQRGGALEAQEAVQAFVRHSVSGMMIAMGWLAVGVGFAIAWVGFGADRTMGTFPWHICAFVGLGLSTLGGAVAAIASFRLLVADPPASVASETTPFTRSVAVIGPAAWSAASLVCLVAVWRYLNPPAALPVDLEMWKMIWLVGATLPLAFYSRVMFVVGSMVGQGERAFQTSVLGLPFGVLFCVGAAWWLEMANWVPLASFVLLLFATLLGGVFPFIFIRANLQAGLGVWWARRYASHAANRQQRKREKWEAAARADIERERRHGNSANL